MKNFIFIFLLLFIVTNTKAQFQKSDSTKLADYQTFMYRVLGFDISAPVGNFIFEATESPALKINGVIRKNSYDTNAIFKRYYGGFSGVLTSKNKYTPIISKDNWVPDASAFLNNYFFFIKSVRYYTDDIKSYAIKSNIPYVSVSDADSLFENSKGAKYISPTVNKMNIKDASSIYLIWVSQQFGYNYSQLNMLNNSNTLSADSAFNKIRNQSFIANAGINFFANPSKKSWFSFIGNLSYQFKSNDNNYNNLLDVTVKSYTIQNNGISYLETSGDEVKGKRGSLRIGNTNSVLGNLGVIISPTNKLYIGVTYYFQRVVANNFQYTDRGFSINLPILKKSDKDKAIANFALKVDYPDVHGEIDPTKTMKDKRRIGFLVSLPLMPSPRLN